MPTSSIRVDIAQVPTTSKMDEPEIDPDEDPDDPGWFFVSDEELDEVEGYVVRFALGFPFDLEQAGWWTSLRHVIVFAHRDQAWVSWECDPDPVEETEWKTRIGSISFTKPWVAVWEYVDWEAKQRFRHLWERTVDNDQ